VPFHERTRESLTQKRGKHKGDTCSQKICHSSFSQAEMTGMVLQGEERREKVGKKERMNRRSLEGKDHDWKAKREQAREKGRRGLPAGDGKEEID